MSQDKILNFFVENTHVLAEYLSMQESDLWEVCASLSIDFSSVRHSFYYLSQPWMQLFRSPDQ